MHTIPTLIVGAGLSGASLACSLAEREAGAGVAIVDIDAFGKFGSSELTAGIVSSAFAERIEATLARSTARYYLENAGRFDFRTCGCLRLSSAAKWHEPPAGASPGAASTRVQQLDPADLQRRFPVLGDLSDVGAAGLSVLDGVVSAHKLRLHYLNHAQAGGVELMDRWQVINIAGDRGPFEVTLRRVGGRGVKRALTDDGSDAAPLRNAAGAAPVELTVQARRLINAAGPWAGRVGRLYGAQLPLTPTPRQTFLLRASSANAEAAAAFGTLPVIIDELRGFAVRGYEHDRKPCVLVSWRDLTGGGANGGIPFGGEALYRDRVAPLVEQRIPCLTGADVIGGWASADDSTPDDRPIIGPALDRPGLYHIAGLGGQGLSLSRALGEAMAILLVHDRWPIGLDLGELTDARFASDAV